MARGGNTLRNKGFTLTELIVVIAATGIFFSLLAYFTFHTYNLFNKQKEEIINYSKRYKNAAEKIKTKRCKI